MWPEFLKKVTFFHEKPVFVEETSSLIILSFILSAWSCFETDFSEKVDFSQNIQLVLERSGRQGTRVVSLILEYFDVSIPGATASHFLNHLNE